jgi:hypothetical protein
VLFNQESRFDELMAYARRSRFDLVLVSASGRLAFSLWISG